ncbi:MAG: coproporphyrinogen dehydrogenase HemZ [Eubacterium sp.]
MILEIINHQYAYDMKNLCTSFFPNERIKETDGLGEDYSQENIVVKTKKENNTLYVSARIFDKSLEQSRIAEKDENEAETISVLLYSVLSSLTGFNPPWGILYGVRPAKLMHRMCSEMGEEKAREYFTNNFLVREKKADLTLEVMKRENEIISLSRENSFSLYVSIPFCPTRCSYCSFVSHSIERTKRLVEPYTDLLCKELESVAKIAKDFGLRLETIYFGGGTPTTLSAKQLTKLFDTIENNFDMSSLREYTVEAGRPDTVTEEKLMALRTAGVDRISINPQSFNDKVLEAIGRKHTSRQTVEAFELARKCGFDNINMDLIAGLPLDTLESFKSSVDKAVSLGAESVTVHTLAMKTAAYLVTKENAFDFSDRLITSAMVDYSDKKLHESGYYPYYMYRQSKSVGNLENVGWCKPNCDCLYNVYMMDETHSVFAAGAGAVTRLKNQRTGKIDRIYNYKYPYEYIDNFDEILNRKKGIIKFYNEY